MEHPNSFAGQPNSLAARDVRSVIHPFTDLAAHAQAGPMVISRGDGVHVIADDGRRYLEGMAGLWCASLGFSEARLVEAAHAQMSALPTYHLFGGKSNAPAIRLAEKLLELAPPPVGPMAAGAPVGAMAAGAPVGAMAAGAKVLFTNSGSEANDSAVKLVRYYWHAKGQPEKRKIVARVRAYHGVTLAAASLTGLGHAHRDFGLPLPDVLHAECPDYYRDGLPGETEAQFATRLAAGLERLILREGPETVGAFIAEPVMGAGGVVLPPETYFEQIQAVLRKYDVLLIADEVITGFGRTGRMFGAETYGIEPDLITVAKGLSAGYQPIGALLISPRLAEVVVQHSHKLGTFGHGFTYSGHPVAAAVALRTLEIYQEDDILGHVATVAPRFAARIAELGAHPLVGDARAVGLVGAIELMAGRTHRIPFDPALQVGARVVAHALEQGVILRPLHDVVSFCPPLIVTEAEIDRLFDVVGVALDRVAHDLASLAPAEGDWAAPSAASAA
jgi:4-aminobutyrate--pyruvate transaminase